MRQIVSSRTGVPDVWRLPPGQQGSQEFRMGHHLEALGRTINSAYTESAEPLTKANSRDDVLLYVAPNAGKVNFGGHP